MKGLFLKIKKSKKKQKISLMCLIFLTINFGLIGNINVNGFVSTQINLNFINDIDNDEHFYYILTVRDDTIQIQWEVENYDARYENVEVKWSDQSSWINKGDNYHSSISRLASSFTSPPGLDVFNENFQVRVYNERFREFVQTETIYFTIHHCSSTVHIENLEPQVGGALPRILLPYTCEIYVGQIDILELVFDNDFTNSMVITIDPENWGTVLEIEISDSLLKSEGVDNGDGICFSKHKLQVYGYFAGTLADIEQAYFNVQWKKGKFTVNIYELYSGQYEVYFMKRNRYLYGELVNKITTEPHLCGQYVRYNPEENPASYDSLNRVTSRIYLNLYRENWYNNNYLKVISTYFTITDSLLIPNKDHIMTFKISTNSNSYSDNFLKVTWSGTVSCYTWIVLQVTVINLYC